MNKGVSVSKHDFVPVETWRCRVSLFAIAHKRFNANNLSSPVVGGVSK